MQSDLIPVVLSNECLLLDGISQFITSLSIPSEVLIFYIFIAFLLNLVAEFDILCYAILYVYKQGVYNQGYSRQGVYAQDISLKLA